MTTRNVSFVPGEFYHIYNRGVDKRLIFHDDKDRERFLQLLFVCNSGHSVNVRDIARSRTDVFEYKREDEQVAIGAYCLMPNHFHILLTPLAENGVAQFMGRLGTSYAMYFNKKYERTGTLFEGRFKARFAESDQYLKYLYAYIHLNPVKLIKPDWRDRTEDDPVKLLDFAKEYKYSSLADYVGSKRPQKVILNAGSFPQYFNTLQEIKGELFEWLTYNEHPFDSPRVTLGQLP